MRKKMNAFGAGLAGILILLAGCQSGGEHVSAAEMVTKAIEAEQETTDFYGESVTKMDVMGNAETFKMKEFHSKNGDRKVITYDEADGSESIAVVKDGKMTMYEQKEKRAMEMDLGEDLPGNSSLKEQMMTMLEQTKGTHDHELAGEETLLGRKTNHLKLKAKKKDSLFGDMEFWVDQKTWLPLKMKTKSGEGTSEMAYTKVDFNPDFPADTFKLDLPKDVKVEKIDPNAGGETVSIEDVEKELGKSVWLIQKDGVKLEEIEKLESMGRAEFNFQYVDAEGKPYVNMSIFAPGEIGGKIEGDKTVRGNKAEEMEEIGSLMWDEDGIRYVLLPEEEKEMKAGELLKLAKEMKQSK